ncbi:MAG: hypothetical protein K0V04_44340 [Deltaproteobacteria bacterium]|nr:hypothetical protein [Deltaproteobacteria bacterium]
MNDIVSRTIGLAALALGVLLAPACDQVEEVQLSDLQFEQALETADVVEVEDVTTRLTRADDGRIVKHSSAPVWIEFTQGGQTHTAGGTISCTASCKGTGCGVKGCDLSGGNCTGAICSSSGLPCPPPTCTKKSSGGGEKEFNAPLGLTPQ